LPREEVGGPNGTLIVIRDESNGSILENRQAHR
jgi:hypothetical protein